MKKTEKDLYKKNKKDLKKSATILALLAAIIGLMITFPYSIYTTIICSIIMGTGVVGMTIKSIKDFKKNKENIPTNFDNNINLSKNSEMNNDYQNFKVDSLLKQTNFSKDDIINLIFNQIDACYKAYQIPQLKITNEQWNSFFDISYELFFQKGIEDKYYNSISSIIRLTFAKAMFAKKESINFDDLISNLYYINNHFTNLNISEKEILETEKNILTQVSKSKIIHLDKYRQKSV